MTARTAKKATTKKTARKKAAAKSSATKKTAAEKLPDADPQPEPKLAPLPRGQERLPDGTIRLKTGDHDLGDEVRTFDVHGARIELAGKVMIGGKNNNWLAITKCQKCNTERTEPVTVRAVKTANGEPLVAITYTCHNDATCQIGGHLYVCVYDPKHVKVEG
jgi:hypothetical protein